MLRRIAISIVALALVLVLGTAGVVAAWLAGVRLPIAFGDEYVEIVKLDSARAAGLPDEGLVFIALIGNDYRPGVGGARGDALHLVGINIAEGQGTMLNVPRDVCVSGGKINNAHARGGVTEQARVLGELAGVPVSYGVSVDFAGFVGMVEELGGVTVNVLEAHDDAASGALFEPGEIRMNGPQALAFSRNRKDFPSGDIQRSANQGYLILEGMRHLQAEMDDPIGKFRVMSALVRHAELDGLGIFDVFDLGQLAFGLNADRIRSETIPTRSGGCTGGLSFAGDAGYFADFADDAILQTH